MKHELLENIKNIEAGQIYQNPYNPRKDLGDLSELSESIKKHGIMQNLTVFPGHWDEKKEWKEDGFTLLIGHRRFAAGKLAGLDSFPCQIKKEMDRTEQVGTMLVENMHRNDLSVLEQANGFQMMLDLGSTEDQIAEKTGFCKATIKHRTNIAKLDQDTLKEKEKQDDFQLSLTDLYELEKIKDIETRNEILKKAESSRDLARLALNAVNEQKRKENLKLFLEALKKLGIEEVPKEMENDFYYSGRIDQLARYDLYTKQPKELKFPEDGRKTYYMVRYSTLYIVRKAKKEKKILSPEEEKKKQKEKNKKQLKAIYKEASNTRKVFIEGIISGKIKPIKEERKVEEELFEQLLGWNSFCSNNTIVEFFLGCDIYNAEKEKIEEVRKNMPSLTMLQKLLCMVSAKIAKTDLITYDYKYKEYDGAKVEAFYQILEKYGFKFANEEEESAMKGTHALYEKKEEEVC